MLSCCIAGTTVGAQVRPKSSTDTLKNNKDTITVTATRGLEYLNEVPLAITVVSPRVMQSSRGFALDDILAFVPGVLAQSRSGGADVRVQIRGFGARGAGERSNAGTSRGVRYYQDGIPETEPDGRTAFDLLDITHASRVEIIRSNASALWGNAAGGIVSITTVPTENSAFVHVGGSLGSFGYNKQTLLANTPMGSGQAYVSLVRQSTDGWRVHSQGELLQGNVGLVAHLSDRTTLSTFIVAAHNEYRIPGALTPEQYAANPEQAQDDTLVYNPTYVQRDEHRNNRLGRIGTKLDHDFGGGHGLSTTAFVQTKYLQRSERNTWRDFTRYHVGGNAVYRNVTVFDSNKVNRILFGGDVQLQDGAVLFFNLDSLTHLRGTSIVDNKREGALNTGLFVEDEIRWQDFSIIGGVRYDNILYSAENYVNPQLDTQRVFDRVTPKVGLMMRFAPMLNVYANLGGGVEVPAGNETNPVSVRGEDQLTALNPLLEPIVSTTYELGSKGAAHIDDSWLESIQYDAAGFMIVVTNDIIPYRNGRFFQTAGRSTRLGGEIGLGVSMAHGLSVLASFTFMSTEYNDYTIDSAFIDTTKAGRTLSFAGNEIAGIPTSFSSLRLRYDATFLDGLYAELDGRMVGSYYADDANALTVDNYTVIDASIGGKFSLIKGVLDLNVLFRLNNATNTTYMASAWINPDKTSGGTPYIEPGLPRNVVTNVSLRMHL
ncbi:MAG: TonB-dependent receptor [bacterium]|nr:TonB-dependent receptor [bacterium]